MAFLRGISPPLAPLAPLAPPVGIPPAVPRATPAPQPSPAGDYVARPVAQPSPGHPDRHPPGRYDALPVLAAAGLIVGGAALAVPAAAEGTAASVTAAGRVSSFIRTALRETAGEYRAEATAKAQGFSLHDPTQFGKALGAQSWSATEDVVRSAIVGAGLAAGAGAAHALGAGLERVVAGSTAHPR